MRKLLIRHRISANCSALLHVLHNEEDDVLDEADAQNGQVVLEEHVQVLVRRVDEELVREDVQLHAHGPRWLLAVALQHAEAAGVHDPQASLQLVELRFVQRRQVQAVVFQVRQAEEHESRERLRLEVSEDDLSDVPADVDEVLRREDVLVDEDKVLPRQRLQHLVVRARQEKGDHVLVECAVFRVVAVRVEQQPLEYAKKLCVARGFVHLVEDSPCYNGLGICVFSEHMLLAYFSGNRGFGKSSM
jgi:hypothetical protein